MFRLGRKTRCDKTRDLLSDYINEALVPGAQQMVDRHLETCDACRKEVESLRMTVKLLRRVEPLPLPRSFRLTGLEKKRAVIPEPRPVRWLKPATVVAVSVLLMLVAGDFTGLFRPDGSPALFAPTQTPVVSAPAAAPAASEPAATQPVVVSPTEGVLAPTPGATAATREVGPLATQPPEVTVVPPPDVLPEPTLEPFLTPDITISVGKGSPAPAPVQTPIPSVTSTPAPLAMASEPTPAPTSHPRIQATPEDSQVIAAAPQPSDSPAAQPPAAVPPPENGGAEQPPRTFVEPDKIGWPLRQIEVGLAALVVILAGILVMSRRQQKRSLK